MIKFDDKFYYEFFRLDHSESYKRKITNIEKQNKIKEILSGIDNHIIPNSYPEYMIDVNSHLRQGIVERIGFPLISKQWIKPLAKWIGNRKCLEVMAGCGSISFALKQEKVNIITTDDYSWNYSENWNADKNYWTDIENIDAIEAVKKYGKAVDVIIMSWAFLDNTAYKVLQTMRQVNNKCLMVYIGEGQGGCTADNKFFNSMIELDDENFKDVYNKFQRWDGVHDYPMLLK